MVCLWLTLLRMRLQVSAQRASTVILLHPDGTKSPAEAEAMKTAAAIAFAVLPAVEGEQQRPPQRMIVQCTSARGSGTGCLVPHALWRVVLVVTALMLLPARRMPQKRRCARAARSTWA